MAYINLKELPVDHKLRNTPLGQIHAEYQLIQSVMWNEVRPSFYIARVTFNQLSEVWTKWDQWRVSDEFM